MHIKQVYKLWKMKVTGSGIFKSICRNNSYLMLFGKIKLKRFEVSCK